MQKNKCTAILILHPNGVRLKNKYIYSKCLQELRYQFLENVIEDVGGVEYFQYSEHGQAASPSEAKPNSISIFDDIACEKI